MSDLHNMNPSIEDAWNGVELKVCHDTVECCKELSRVWLALGDAAIKRPYLGSASERVRKLRGDVALLMESTSGLRDRLNKAREAIAIILRGFDQGVFVRSTSQDQNPKWAIELLPYIQALKALHDTADQGSADAQKESCIHSVQRPLVVDGG